MKITLATGILIVVLVCAFAFSSVNTYLIFNKNQALQQQIDEANHTNAADIYQLNSTSHNPIQEYDYIIFQWAGSIVAKDGANEQIVFNSTNADLASVLNWAFTHGNNVYLKSGYYTLSGDVNMQNKRIARLDADNALIMANGHIIRISGDQYTDSQYNEISGIDLINGTLRIENSFSTTVSGMIFENSTTALELANTKTWTEGTKIEDSSFKNNAENIVFRTNVGDSTGSYSSSEISRCYFNLLDNSVAIHVEPQAELSDSILQDVRIWIAGNGKTNQTGLLMDGSMYKTQLSSTVFESFAQPPVNDSNLYAISLGKDSDQSPILAGGVSFLGNWTARINNPYSKWVYGYGSAVRQEDINVTIGTNGQYGPTQSITTYPATLENFRVRIQVQMPNNGETVTVKIQLELVDNSVTAGLEKTFTNNSSVWLTDDDMLQLFPSQNVIWSVLTEAKTGTASTSATVSVDIYGITT
jgi:hypothetical protein